MKFGLKLKTITYLGALISLAGMLGYPAHGAAQSQTLTVSGSVQITNVRARSGKANNGDVVVWLTPLNGSRTDQAVPQPVKKKRAVLLQKNKTFAPHVLVIPVGSEVDFPNKDPFFHNVFSLFEGKRFDLGLYESGTSRVIRFERPGISYLFCNIHSEMSAVIIALETPYFATSNAAGEIRIPDVPAGRYLLHVWRDGAAPETLKNLSRQVVIAADSASLGKLLVPDNASVPLAHKNKYGRDYEDPTPPGQIYNDHM